MRPGFTYDPVTGAHIPIAPYHDPRASTLQQENAELKQRVLIDPMSRRLEELEKKKDHSVAALESPMKGMIEMIQLQQAESQRQRDHQITVDREERRAREVRETEDRRLERDRLEKKVEIEREEQRARADRDREDRAERDKDRSAMMSMVIKAVTGDGGKNKSDPTETMLKMVQVLAGVKDLTTPAGKSETAEIIEAATQGGQHLINSVGDAVRNRNNAPAAQAPAPKTDDEQLLDVMSYMTELAKTKQVRPRDAFTAMMAFCAGRTYDGAKIMDKIKGLNTAEAVARFRDELKAKSTSTLVPEAAKTQLREASTLLEDAGQAQWLLEVGQIAAK